MNYKLNNFNETKTNISNSNEFILMNKDTEVLKFNTKKNIHGRYDVVNIYNKESMPYLLKSDISNFDYWLDDRTIATNRQHIDEVITSLGLKQRDKMELLKINNATSLNDTYWIKQVNSNITWKDINLYNNSFEEALGIITYFGNKSSLGGNLRTPEVTTGGSVGKAWREIDNKLYLYKKNNIGNENVSEVIASRVAKILGLKHIKYSTGVWRDIDCSICELYTTEDTGYLTAINYLISRGNKQDYYSITDYKSLFPEWYYEFIEDMIVFDFIIENRDRHFSNFGFEINNDTQEIVGAFPIFDNGYSLFNNRIHQELLSDNLVIYSDNGTFNIDNITQCKYILESSNKSYKDWSDKILNNLDYIIEPAKGDFKEDIKFLINLRCNQIKRWSK